MFMSPGKSLASWVLLLEQESYLSYIKKVLKTIFETTDPYTTIIMNKLEETLNTIIGENQSAAINKIEQFYILFLRLICFAKIRA